MIKKLSHGGILTIYNDPKGQPLADEKNYGALMKAMANPDLNIVDLQVQFQHNDDCGPWI